MSGPQQESAIPSDSGQNSTNTTATTEEAKYYRQVLDELYERIASENDPAKLQKVLLSSSYPSPIGLKLQGIQEMLKDSKGSMDIDSINFAIRKLRREETIDRSPTDSESMIRKYYFGTDFARIASNADDGLSDLETCVRNDFVYHHHNAFGQDPDLSVQELLFIPVVHHGCWSLYAFNISDKKLSIFDPAPDRAFNMSYEKRSNPTSVTESGVKRLLVATPESEHDNSRLKICKALDFVKDNFNLFKNASGKFSNWGYEFNDLGQCRKASSLPAAPLGICSDEDSGFFIFNLMRRWDGQRFANPGEIPKPEKLRKCFLEYIASFNCNEAYELDDLPDVFRLMEKLKRRAQKVSGRPAWTRCKMDTGLLKVVREKNTHGFAGLFEVLKDDYQKRKMLRRKLRRGATSDGDGMLHIAARYGDLELLCVILNEAHVKLDLKAIKSRMLEGSRMSVKDDCVHVLPTTEVAEVEWPQRLLELQEMLRSRNHKGETCLHEAVRYGDELFALSLILADEKIMKDVVIKTNGPLLVQIVDYEGVSPLYLATTLCRSDIVRTILTYEATSGQLANQEEIPAPDNQSPFCCWHGKKMPASQQIQASSDQNQTSEKCAWLRQLFAATKETGPQNGMIGIPAPAKQIVASFSGPGGKTALHAAVILNEELTKQILDWMIHVKDVPDLTVMSDSSGNTPLHLVSSVDDRKYPGAAIAELLLSTAKVASSTETAGKPTCAALKKDYSKGWLPIHVAAANGSLGVIKQLIENCPECIETRNARGQSFLHVAVEKKSRKVVRYVCSQQSLAGILNLTDQDGNTALHLAVESGNQRMFCDLMANPRVCLSSANREGCTPLDVAKLSIGTGIRLLLSSRILIYYHLKRSGAHYGTCRRDVLDDELAGKHDKDKVSETISKSAGLITVCAIFILNMSVTTFFNIAKQNIAPTDPNTAAAPPSHAPLAASTAEGSRSARLRVRAFKYLIAADAITFSSSLLAASCSTFAGLSIMDRPTRFIYLNIALLFVQISGLGLVAILILAAYLAFSPIDPHITKLACVLPIAVLIPQLVTAYTLYFLHARTIYLRMFRKHISPKILVFFETCFPAKKFTPITNIFTKIKEKMEPIWTCFLTKIKAIVRPIPICLRYCILLVVVVVVVGAMALAIYLSGLIFRDH